MDVAQKIREILASMPVPVQTMVPPKFPEIITLSDPAPVDASGNPLVPQ